MATTRIFIDSRVNDQNLLISQFAPGTPYQILDARLDGIEQITTALAWDGGYDSIQIISHGMPGSVMLGSTMLNSSMLGLYTAELALIGNALTESGDLLLYGCNVAAGAEGRQFIDTLSQMTGADVGASDDATGGTAAGGDWVLEASTGVVDQSVVLRGEGYTALLVNVAPVIYLPGASLSFAAKVDISVGSSPSSVTSADVNGDGRADLVVANQWSCIVSVLTNNGDGIFVAYDYSSGAAPSSVTTTDVDGDGHVDLVVANANGGTVSVLLNNGDGTFGIKEDYGTGNWPRSVIAADVNGDNKSDIVVSNYYNNTLSVLLNNGFGKFLAQTEYAAGPNTLPYGPGPLSVTAIDVDHDGWIDLAVANTNDPSNVSVLKNIGDGKFSAPEKYGTGEWAYFVTANDLNGDGWYDLVVAESGSTTSVSVLMNNGDGTFASRVGYFAGSKPVSVTTADINGDGWLDLAVTNKDSNTLSVFLNKQNGTFAVKEDYSTGSAPTSATAADVNGDGKADLVVANSGGNSISVLKNTSLQASTSFIEQTPVVVSSDIVINDPDGDTSWNGGSLKLQITANAEVSDTLSLSTSNPGGSGIWLDTNSNSLMSGSTIIGTANAASVSNGQAWTLNFNANATNALVQNVARAVTFNNSSDTPGTANRSVSFTVTDNGALSAPNIKAQVTVIAVNDPPTGTNATLTMLEDASLTVSAANFGFSDVDGDALAKVMITTLPTVGTLNYNAVAVTLNQEITKADIDAGKLQCTPLANANGTGYATIGFKVNDGTEYSTAANTLTINVTPVNDPPTGTNATLTTLEDASLTVSAANFGFSDVDGDALAKVMITTLPTVGTLKYNALAVTLNQEITKADIDAGKLQFTPFANANGSGYATIGFKVNDGTVYSTAANILTINVTPVDIEGISISTYSKSGYEGLGYTSLLNNAVDIGANFVGLGSLSAIDLKTGVVSDWIQSTSGFNGSASIASIESAIAAAEAKGLNVFLKPQINALNSASVPNTGQQYTSLIDSSLLASNTPENTKAFFAGYESYILEWAALAQKYHVPLLSIGNEMMAATKPEYTDYWNHLIDSVRAIYSGNLTYAALTGITELTKTINEAAQIEFWGKLDYVGVDIYPDFPTGTATPTVAELDAVWTSQGWKQYLADIAAKTGKPIIFTETGTPSFAGSANRSLYTDALIGQPATQRDDATQANWYQSFMNTWAGSQRPEWLAGSIFWNNDPGANGLYYETGYSINEKPANIILTSAFGGTNYLSLTQKNFTGSGSNDSIALYGDALGLVHDPAVTRDKTLFSTVTITVNGEIVGGVTPTVHFSINGVDTLPVTLSNTPRVASTSITESFSYSVDGLAIGDFKMVMDPPVTPGFKVWLDNVTVNGTALTNFTYYPLDNWTVETRSLPETSLFHGGYLSFDLTPYTTILANQPGMATNPVVVDGGGGSDTVSVLGHPAQYLISSDASGVTRLVENSGLFQNAVLSNISAITFADGSQLAGGHWSTTNGAIDVPVGNDIVLTFSTAIQKGAGTIALHSGGVTGPVVEYYDVASSGKLAVSGSTLTVNPTLDLAGGTYYFFTATDGSLLDISGNSVPINSSYDFTTATLMNVLPTLTAFSVPIDVTSRDSRVEITFAELMAKGNAADVDGSVTAFVIKEVSSGSLLIGENAVSATAYNASSNNMIDATQQAFWIPSLNANGTLDAFTAVARDNGGAESMTAIQATVNVTSIPHPPVDLTGHITFWKTGVPIAGVTSSLTSVPAITAIQPIEFRNIHLAADGSRTIEIWETSSKSDIGSVDLDFTLPTGSVATWQNATGLPSGWTLLANTENPGEFILGGMGVTALSTGSVQLGTLTLTAPTNPQHFELQLSSGTLGNDTIPAFGLSTDSMTTALDGLYQHLDMLDGTYALTSTKASATAESNAIKANDALAALKIAVGMNPNTDGSAVSPYQYLAADVNHDGVVKAVDALNILKMAVKLSTAPQKEWFFVPESVGSETLMSRTNVLWPDNPIPVTLDADQDLDLIGIVKGDVNGSWVA